MDMSLFESALISSLSTVSSWNVIWADASEGENTSITETELSTTIGLRTLKSLLSRITPASIILDHRTGSLSANASNAVSIFNASVLRLSSTLELSALALVIAQEADASLGVGAKPNWEPICLARKPLSEATVAANVLRWGPGALNIDACRIGTEKREYKGGMGRFNEAAQAQGYRPFAGGVPSHSEETFTAAGRWPANLIHDGSAEVLAAFPDSSGGHWSGETPSLVGAQRDAGPESFDLQTGSAARFFYSSKADANDRIGSKHPTVKPVDLMQYLVRLVTPPGGTVLDPFGGTGTTAEAAWREGFKAILCEREPVYIADIARRMKYVLGGPDERKHAILKARGETESAGPLFD